MKKIFTLLRLSFLLVIFTSISVFNSKANFIYRNTKIASLASDSTGLFVRIAIPTTPRFTCGAPIVIYMNGGWSAEGILTPMFNMANYGFIVVQFHYPGGGSGVYKSGGVYDNRGPNSMLAARDLVRFALGQTTDIYNRSLGEITDSINPLYYNLGIIGGSNGGCNLLSLLGLYSQDLNQVAWTSFFESPIGDGMLNADVGKPYGKAVYINKNDGYNDSTGIFYWNKLAYAADTVAYKNGKITIKGLLYFDVNENGIFNRGIDFDIIGKYESTSLGAPKKYYLSYQVMQHAYEQGIFPNTSQSIYVPTLAESQEYWYLRNTDHFIDSFMVNIPNLKVLFMVREDDHITSALDHPETIYAWNKFNSNGCNWFRVNCDRSYIEFIKGSLLPNAPDNDANISVDHMNIRNMIMPAGLFSNRYFNHYASTLEMGDRVMNNDWSYNLDGLLNKTCPEAKLESETVTEKSVDNLLYPNPAQNETYIQVNASDFGTSTVTVFNAIGQQMMPTQIDEVEKGFNLLILDVNKLSSGNYFVRINAPGMNRTLQFTRE